MFNFNRLKLKIIRKKNEKNDSFFFLDTRLESDYASHSSIFFFTMKNQNEQLKKKNPIKPQYLSDRFVSKEINKFKN